MKATKVGLRYQISDGPDLVFVWLNESGIHSQRVSNINKENELSHSELSISISDLILAAEGQKKLL